MAALEQVLRDSLGPAFEAIAGGAADPVLRRSQHADYQADGALRLARRLGRPPRQIAELVLRQVNESAALADLCGPMEVSGPGFINLTVTDDALNRLLTRMSADERLGVDPVEPETVVVDYSAPNLAKHMHVGHLRSTIIGDAAVRLLTWLGHRVVKANHVGDWGTPLCMLIEQLRDTGQLPDQPSAAGVPDIDELTLLYQTARSRFDADRDFAERARARVVALQSGDEATMVLWRAVVERSQRCFLELYARLDVQLGQADFVGESFYHDQLADVVSELDRRRLLVESQDALCAFPEGFAGRDGQPLPVIVRKSDGGFGYGATDLAAIRHRTEVLAATRLLYVVGLPQRKHLEMIFTIARQAGWLCGATTACHIGFGSVLGQDGRMLRTRAGGSVKLADLVAEALARAEQVVSEKNPHLTEAARGPIVHAVGIDALKYVDLSSERTKDYVFDVDRMLSLHGNTAAYLQFARARGCSILHRASGSTPGSHVFGISAPAEHRLAIELLAFPAVVSEVAETLEFHRLAGHLYEVASAFTEFLEKCQVLRSAPAQRASRLALCELSTRTLGVGMHLLGIAAPDRM